MVGAGTNDGYKFDFAIPFTASLYVAAVSHYGTDSSLIPHIKTITLDSLNVIYNKTNAETPSFIIVIGR